MSAAGFTADFAPASTSIAQAFGSLACRVVIASRATAPIEGSASPRNPSVADREQIVLGQLRGGVALDREREVRARHPGAVVGDADEPPPAAVGHDLDAPRAGIERVLDQFLHDARRALDHLAGGDAVDDGFGELADGHRATSPRCASREFSTRIRMIRRGGPRDPR